MKLILALAVVMISTLAHAEPDILDRVYVNRTSAKAQVYVDRYHRFLLSQGWSKSAAYFYAFQFHMPLTGQDNHTDGVLSRYLACAEAPENLKTLDPESPHLPVMAAYDYFIENMPDGDDPERDAIAAVKAAGTTLDAFHEANDPKIFFKLANEEMFQGCFDALQ